MQLSNVLLVAGVSASAATTTASPIAKVITMLSDLEAKVIKEGESGQKEFAAFSEWCEDRNRNLDFEIKTGKSEVEELKAAIAKESALTMSLNEQVEQLAAGIATDDADLKAATQIREKEAADFGAEEKELVETVDILRRAIAVLEREMAKSPAMLQTHMKNAENLAEALSAMVQASFIGTSDAAKLTAFMQSSADSQDSDEETGAPDAAAYKSKSGSIVDTLESLLDKAEDQLDQTRKKEVNAKHNYEMLKQSLEDELSEGNKDLDAAKKGIAGSAEKKATAEGDLQTSAKELKTDIEVKGTLHHDCMSRSSDFEAEVKSRAEELKVLAQAKKIIAEATGGAASFFQLDASIASSVDLANFEAVRLIRDLARKEHSPMLAQLAQRIAGMVRAGAGSANSDPFGKVKALITDMIGKLEKEAGADATKKSYCDKELKETNQKKLEKTTEIEMLGTKIDQATAKSAKLKEDVAMLENELSKLMKSQAEADKLRQEEKEAFTANKAEQEKGLEGVRAAIEVLKEYYAKADDAAHDAADGAASGIIGLLEVVESDFTKTLAALMTEEETSAAEYDTMTRKNDIEKATKEQDVKYKTKESKSLDKSTVENQADRNGVQAELDAILEYLAKIEEQCIAKPESYAERARRREAEVAGLKEALEILESETALIQGGRKRLHKSASLRGVSPHGR